MLKRFHLLLIGVLVLAILFSAALVFIIGSRAASNAPTNQHPHIVVLPTRQQAQQHASAAVAAHVQGAGDLVWNGGPVEEQPRVFVIFWGPAWNNGSGGLTPDGVIAENYFSDVGSSSLENILTQYGDKHAYVAVSLSVGGFWADFSTPPTDTTCGGPTIEDSAIQNEVNKAISSNGWPRDINNSTYLVYTANGFSITTGGNPNSCSEAAFCAYHSLSLVAGVPYAAIPYPSNQGQCGIPTSPNNNPAGDSLANLGSAEQFNSITDPQQNAWIDNAGFEIAAKCAFDFSAGPTHLHNNGVFEVQTEYSNSSHACVNSLSRLQVNPPGISVVTPPATNAPTQTVALKNASGASISWSAGALPAWVSVTPTTGTVGAGASTTLTFTFNTSAPQQVYNTSLTISDTGGVNGPLSLPIMVVQAASPSKTWYFAEGYTGGSFTEFLTIANPNNVQANVTVTYLLGTGSPIIQNYAVAPNSRFTQNVGSAIAASPDKNVSMVVQSDQPIIAERPMYFTYTALTGYTIPGGSDVLGATSLAENFDFGYLDTDPGYDTWLTILNQNNATMNVTIQYFPAAGGTPITITHAVAPNSRGTVHVNTEVGLPVGQYSALVTLDQPGLVERPLYLRDSQTGYTGAADVVGVAMPQQNWYFAEGYTSSTFEERYILSNPSTTTSANATVIFFKSDGTTVSVPVSLAPGQQKTVDGNMVLTSNNVNNSAVVQADQPILAERFISFRYTGPVGGSGSASLPGASDVLGAAAPGNVFYFAEGYSGSGFGEYLTIENPNINTTATVIVTFLPANGSAPTVRVYQVPSGRSTIFANGVLGNQSFSMVVTSTLPIVAERPMYFNFLLSGQTGGSDVLGYQP
jgi:hypothetical protein